MHFAMQIAEQHHTVVTSLVRFLADFIRRHVPHLYHGSILMFSTIRKKKYEETSDIDDQKSTREAHQPGRRSSGSSIALEHLKEVLSLSMQLWYNMLINKSNV